ncbi:MAG: GNAT family N-acetyltransferase [Anaerolineae bacterium]|jgi:GNAT superfamily N-acetyltransferase
MNEEYEIVYVDEPEQSAWGIIGRGIRDFNVEQVGDSSFQRLCFILQSPDGGIAGGVLGETYWDWFHLDLLWVREDLRGRGFGSRLLSRAEEEARERGAKHAYLDTFSFQGPDFYRRHGYEVFGELSDFPVGHQRYFFEKRL